ncbi:MAG TPA: methionyl-tRNA formyltransferase [Acidimicrobiales bacterium]
MPLAPVPRRPQRLVFLGTPEVAVPPLRALVESGFPVDLVVTRVDKRRGRGSVVAPSPVKAAALELGLPVSHRVDDVLESNSDLGVVVAFGQIIKPHVLERLAMVNLHFSLLPRWRGAAPMERALLAGDAETGVCLMQLEEGLDTGPVFGCERVPIGARTTAAELREALVGAGTGLLVRSLLEGLGEPRPQEGEPTHAPKIHPDELRLRWDRPAVELDRLVRLGNAFTTFRGRRLKVVAAEPVAVSLPLGELHDDAVGTCAGGLRLIAVQPEGKGSMSFGAWRNGAHPVPGEHLGSES